MARFSRNFFLDKYGQALVDRMDLFIKDSLINFVNAEFMSKCVFRGKHGDSVDIDLHQDSLPSDHLYVMLAGCDWWISIRSVDNTQD